MRRRASMTPPAAGRLTPHSSATRSSGARRDARRSGIDITPPPPAPRPDQVPPPTAPLAASPTSRRPRDAARVDIDAPGPLGDAAQRPHSPALKVRGAISVRWEGAIEPETTGDHTFHAFSNNDIRSGSTTASSSTLAQAGCREGRRARALEAGAGTSCASTGCATRAHRACSCAGRPRPPRRHALWSEVGDGVDYYFIHGPRLDGVIAGYRRLTGAAAMLPKWLSACAVAPALRDGAGKPRRCRGFRRAAFPSTSSCRTGSTGRAPLGSHAFDPSASPTDGWIRKLHGNLTRGCSSRSGRSSTPDGQLRGVPCAGWLYSPTSTRAWPTGSATGSPSTMRSTPKRAASTGRRSRRRFSAAGWTRGG